MIDFSEKKASDEKLNLMNKLQEDYSLSLYVSDNFSFQELEEMDRTLKCDPWLWYTKDKGFTISVADKIAQHLNIPFDNKRNKAIYMAMLENFIDFGHCYARNFQLEKKLKENNFPMEELESIQEKLTENQKIYVTKGGKIYPKRLLFSEKYFAQCLVDLANSAMAYFDNVCIEHPAFNILADEQKKVIHALQKSNLVILTGLPGTGKTRTVSVISQIYGEENVVLCAPTGKAAKRITELCGMEARTLHSILFFTEYQKYEIEGNGTLQNKLVIVDEASMMDIEIAGKLAIALDKTSCKLLIVGDTCQLPSVGPGEVLKQIVESGIGIHCHLTEIRRQQPGSIIKSAHAIAQGKNLVKEEDKEVQTYYYNNPDSLQNLITKISNSPKWNDAQFLTVLKEYGSDLINPIIQNIINPGNGIFREKDKVIHLKNDKQNNVMNGDTGTIRKVFKTGDFIAEYSDKREVYYSKKTQWMVSLSYAFTVHKSQGSEFEKVVFLLNKSRITTRNLLYTGLTRAKRKILLIAENEDILFNAIDNVDQERQSSLKAYIKYFSKEKGVKLNE